MQFNHKTVVMYLHNPDLIMYENGSIWNSKRGEWIKPTLYINKKTGYKWFRVWIPDNLLNGGKRTNCSLARLIGCYLIDTKSYLDGVLDIDHKNRNSLDNRVENLHWVTTLQNNLNRDIYSNNTSGFRGVSYDEKRKRWCSTVAGVNTRHKNKFSAILDFRKRHSDTYGSYSEYYNNWKIKQSEIGMMKKL